MTLQVRAPQLTVAPSSFDYTVRIGATSFTASLYITNTGEVPVTWNLVENPAAAWLSQSATTGVLNPGAGAGATVTLTFNPAGLAEATYNTTLRITGGSVERTVPVTLRVANYRVYLPLVIRN